MLRSGKPSAGNARPLKPASRLLARSRPELPGSNGKRDAFMATPIGAATLGKDAGQAFCEVQLEVGGHTGSAGIGSTDGRRLSGLGARG